ncbi:MAG: LysM peptidoglycan-binding domain-containing protein [Deltaproteobacteria bacterium]|nr:LysM peptidoglycan-binding domain-containing protein [Deltaproteobacteria bacterium]
MKNRITIHRLNKLMHNETLFYWEQCFSFQLLFVCFALILFLAAGPPKMAHAGDARKSLTYTVRRGDTLSDIALRYQVSVAQLRRWNGLSSDTIMQGQQLRLWPDNAPRWYVVRRGESLSEIALQFNLTTATLQRLNGITRDRIYPGQRISLQIWSH